MQNKRFLNHKYSKEECEAKLLKRWPTFKKFLNMCLKQIGDDYKGDEYKEEPVVGSVPSVSYLITAPGEPEVILTFWAPE